MADSLFLSALRTQSLSFRIEEYLAHVIETIAEQTLTKAIRAEAVRKKMPQRYINNIHTEYDGQYLWVWVDFKGKDNLPLDFFFESGTKRHKIMPRKKKALRFVLDKGLIVGHQVVAFSKGHWVSGLRPRHVFRQGFKRGYPRFKKKLEKELEKFLKETSLFG